VPFGRPLTVAVVLAVLAAFGWSTYYIFVLWASPAAAPSPVLVFPFLFGGVIYLFWAYATGAGPSFAALWRSPAAWFRTSLLVTMQLSVIAATYLIGPVDASLLSLIGDVVATPLVVAFILGSHRAQVASPVFGLGLLLSLVGGTMAILGGKNLSSIPPAGWLVVPAEPLTIAFYFILTAKASETAPMSAVVGQSMLAAGLLSAVLSVFVPGGWAGLVHVPPIPLFLLVVTGVSSFFVAPVLYFVAIEKVGLVIPPMLMTGIPVFTLLLSAVFLALPPPLIALLGVPIAVVGGVLSLRAGGGSSSPAEVPGGP